MSQSSYVTDGRKVRLLRDRAGYTLRRFAAEVGVDYGHMGRIERGARQPGIELRNRMAEVLGVSVDDIAALPDRIPAAA